MFCRAHSITVSIMDFSRVRVVVNYLKSCCILKTRNICLCSSFTLVLEFKKLFAPLVVFGSIVTRQFTIFARQFVESRQWSLHKSTWACPPELPEPPACFVVWTSAHHTHQAPSRPETLLTANQGYVLK